MSNQAAFKHLFKTYFRTSTLANVTALFVIFILSRLFLKNSISSSTWLVAIFASSAYSNNSYFTLPITRKVLFKWLSIVQFCHSIVLACLMTLAQQLLPNAVLFVMPNFSIFSFLTTVYIFFTLTLCDYSLMPNFVLKYRILQSIIKMLLLFSIFSAWQSYFQEPYANVIIVIAISAVVSISLFFHGYWIVLKSDIKSTDSK